MYEDRAGTATTERGGLLRPASAAGLGMGKPVATRSLAEAFERLEKEVSLLEGAGKGLSERVAPFLEPMPQPTDAMAKEPARAALRSPTLLWNMSHAFGASGRTSKKLLSESHTDF